MAVVTYPAASLGAPKRAPKQRRNASENSAAPLAALFGIGLATLGTAAAVKFRRPALAIGAVVVGSLAAALTYEAERATR